MVCVIYVSHKLDENDVIKIDPGRLLMYSNKLYDIYYYHLVPCMLAFLWFVKYQTEVSLPNY